MSSAIDSPTEIANYWILQLSQANTIGAFVHLFASNGWMRDFLCFSWDFRSSEGPQEIAKYLTEKPDGNKTRFESANISNVILDVSSSLGPPTEDSTLIVAGIPTKAIVAYFTFTVKNPDRACRGCVHLIDTKSENGWKAFMFFAAAEDIVGHEEPTTRTVGIWEDHTKTYEEVQAEYIHAVETDPTVIVVGGAQNGLMCAARLKRMGIRVLVIEQSARIGDVWRKRYPVLSLHLIANICALLYQPWPETYPKFIPKDMVADSLEAYAITQNLAIWLSSTVLSNPAPKFNETTKRWTVFVKRKHDIVTLEPKHIIMATGNGKPNIPTFRGQGHFKGVIYHSDYHTNQHQWAGKRTVVIGAGSASCDIAMSFLSSKRRAASVTIVQRSPSCVVSGKTMAEIISHEYPDSRHILDSDFIGMSKSPGLALKMAREGGLATLKEMDKEMLAALEVNGFKTTYELTPGGGEVGALGFFYEKATSGSTLDMGVSKHIVDGSIQVKSGVDVEEFDEDGIVLSDGTRLNADIVVLGTGNRPIIENITSVFGEGVCRKIGSKVWGIDETGEVRNVYRPTNQPGLWIAAGGFQYGRFFSKYLGLQILAEELGLK